MKGHVSQGGRIPSYPPTHHYNGPPIEINRFRTETHGGGFQIPRPAKPFYWKARDGWYATFGTKKVLLAKGRDGREAAVRAFHKLKAAGPAAPDQAGPDDTTADLCRLYLDHARDNLAPLTAEWYARHLKSFVKACGTVPAADLRPHHVVNWVGSHEWGPSTRNGAIRAVKRVFSWATRMGYMASDPIRHLERPPMRRRELIPVAGQVSAVMEVVKDAPFHDYLLALWATGCRPGEVRSLTAAGVDVAAGTWTVVNKTRHKGDPTRSIYLTETLVELSRRLIVEHPEGPIFRNLRGRPWTRNAVVLRFRRLRVKLGMGKELTAYGLRHLYITDALEKGMPPATLAELVGHRNITMIMQVYSKLKQRTQHLRDAAGQVRPDDQKP